MNRVQCAARGLPGVILWASIGFWLAGCGGGAGENGPPPAANGPVAAPDFSEEVKAVLENKTQLIQQLASEPTVVEAVRTANEKNAELTKAEIHRLDEKWQNTDGLDDFIKSFLTNECAQHLLDFQEAHDEFPEVFITDRRGLIVAETNRTSDYYQADEQWWTQAYQDGRGQTHHGPIEYDESACAEAISLYVPVVDPDTQQAIGVVKAVCDITAIKMEL